MGSTTMITDDDMNDALESMGNNDNVRDPGLPSSVSIADMNTQNSNSSANLRRAPVSANRTPSTPNRAPSGNTNRAPSGNTSHNKNEQEEDVKGATLPVGMKIDDRYEIVGILGVGGFATVYKAHHLMIDRDVALKVMDIQKGVDKSYQERFFREAKIAAKIHHNNVVAVYDFGFVAETQQPYIAMEMLRGHDLAHEISQKGPLSPKRAFVLFRPVLDALAEGHRLGIVHKDLKPENLFLTDPGGAHESMKVLDFGVARLDSGEVAKLTNAGQLLGTPRYLAPEYIKTQQVTPAIDVYQMALILSEALIGVSAVTGDPFHAMMLHCQGDLRIADFLLEGAIGDVFRKAITINPDERYQNCEEFANALDSIEEYFESNVPIQGGAPQLTPERRISSKIIGMPTSGNTKAATSMLASPVAPSIEMEPESSRASNKFPIIVVILLAIILLIVGYILVSKTSNVEEANSDVVQVPTVDESYEFQFTSNPTGAKITIKGTPVVVCSATPCSHKFMKEELPLTLIVEKEGYHTEEAEASIGLFRYNEGKVNVDLKEEVKKIEAVTFTFNVDPASVAAQLFDADGVMLRRCKERCSYKYTPSADNDTILTLANAPGYEEFTICFAKTGSKTCDSKPTANLIITEQSEKSQTISLTKTKVTVKPRPTSGVKTNTAPTQNTTAEPPQKKPDNKPKIKLFD